MTQNENIFFSSIEETLSKYIQDKGSDFILISHPTIFDIYKEKILKIFQEQNKRLEYVLFEEGEKNKTRQTKEIIEDTLLEKGVQKDACLIALGGGVVLDMAGYVAATYLRGINSIYIPTTLLAMCDAAIGGKCGVNTKFGKNQIGTFNKCDAIFVDMSFLKTLEEREMKNGLVEMIKHFLLRDKDLFFKFLEDENPMDNLLLFLKKSIAIKQEIILEDRFDKNLRKVLNFGHSIAHALESIYGFNISHGQAVAIGIIAEAILSHHMGYLTLSSLNIITDVFSKYLPQRKIPISKEEILFFLQRDKKNRERNIHFILLEEIGKVKCHEKYVSHPIDNRDIIVSLSKLEEAISCLSVQ